MSTSPLAEPTIDVGDTNLLTALGLDGTFASTTGWLSTSEGSGSASFLAAGTGRQGGATKAWRGVWSGAAEDACNLDNSVNFSATQRLIMTFWVKSSSMITDNADNAGLKWLLFRRDPDTGDAADGRITWGLTSLNDIGGVPAGAERGDGGMLFAASDQQAARGVIQNIDRTRGWTTTSHVRSPAANDNTAHRFTYEANTVAKYMRIWMDGVLILNTAGLTPNMPSAGFKGIRFGANNAHVISATTIDVLEISALFSRAA